jgi:hypothetical protein
VDHTSDGKRNRKDVNFIGYTFKRDVEKERSGVISALENLEKIKQSNTRLVTTISTPSIIFH